MKLIYIKEQLNCLKTMQTVVISDNFLSKLIFCERYISADFLYGPTGNYWGGPPPPPGRAAPELYVHLM